MWDSAEVSRVAVAVLHMLCTDILPHSTRPTAVYAPQCSGHVVSPEIDCHIAVCFQIVTTRWTVLLWLVVQSASRWSM